MRPYENDPSGQEYDKVQKRTVDWNEKFYDSSLQLINEYKDNIA